MQTRSGHDQRPRAPGLDAPYGEQFGFCAVLALVPVCWLCYLGYTCLLITTGGGFRYLPAAAFAGLAAGVLTWGTARLRFDALGGAILGMALLVPLALHLGWRFPFPDQYGYAFLLLAYLQPAGAIGGFVLVARMVARWRRSLPLLGKRDAIVIVAVACLGGAAYVLLYLPLLRSARKDYIFQLAASRSIGPEESGKVLTESPELLELADGDGRRPLHVAARNGYVDLVELFLRHGAAVDAPDAYGFTPLHLAAERGSAEVVRALLAADADPNASSRRGATPLHRAILADMPVVKPASPEAAGTSACGWWDVWYPLFGRVSWTDRTRAVDRDRPRDVIRLLLDAGARADARDDRGRTAAEQAARLGKPDLARLIAAEQGDQER